MSVKEKFRLTISQVDGVDALLVGSSCSKSRWMNGWMRDMS